jgi:arylsulfatase A-like enzyme
MEFVTKMGRLKLRPGKCFDVRVADKTVDCIRNARSGPLMVTCSFNAPHDPNVVASPYYEMFDPAAIKLPVNAGQREPRHEQSWSREIVQTLGEPGLREFLRIYYASVKLVDDQVGRILQALEETGRLDHTLVVFTADHGDMAGGHGMIWKSNNSFYDEIMRVPLLMRCPSLFRPQRSNMAVDLTDLMPTLLSVAGTPIPAIAQGQDLIPFLTGRRNPSQARPYGFCERITGNSKNTRALSAGSRGSFAVRGQGWKYIRYDDGQESLYDLASDPGELANLAENPGSAAQKQRMITALENWWCRTGWKDRRTPSTTQNSVKQRQAK